MDSSKFCDLALLHLDETPEFEDSELAGRLANDEVSDLKEPKLYAQFCQFPVLYSQFPLNSSSTLEKKQSNGSVITENSTHVTISLNSN